MLEKLGGKRGGQIVAAILKNFDTVENSLDTMSNSAGNADKEMGIITESISYHLNQLSQTWVGIAQNLFQSDSLKFLIDTLTFFSNLLSEITGKAGLLRTALGGIGLYKIGKSIS